MPLSRDTCACCLLYPCSAIPSTSRWPSSALAPTSSHGNILALVDELAEASQVHLRIPLLEGSSGGLNPPLAAASTRPLSAARYCYCCCCCCCCYYYYYYCYCYCYCYYYYYCYYFYYYFFFYYYYYDDDDGRHLWFARAESLLRVPVLRLVPASISDHQRYVLKQEGREVLESRRRACRGCEIANRKAGNPKSQPCTAVKTPCFAHSAASCQSQKHLSTASASRGLVITRPLSNASL